MLNDQTCISEHEGCTYNDGTCIFPYVAALEANGISRLFFFRAEDGIRVDLVTGVQTCALPIYAFVALQPPRGYQMDAEAIYHQPDLAPTHHYYAFYRWLRDTWRANA